MITVLGIDAGQVRLGLSSLTLDNDEIKVRRGAIIHHYKTDMPFNKYLNEGIYNICELFPFFLDYTRPDFIVAEIIPVGKLGSNTELNVAAITTCKVIAWQWGIEWKDIAANTVKKLVTGDGRANKTSIRNSVISKFPNIGTKHEDLKKEEKILGIKPEGFPQDLFDAVAIGWAGLIKYQNEKETETECI